MASADLPLAVGNKKKIAIGFEWLERFTNYGYQLEWKKHKQFKDFSIAIPTTCQGQRLKILAILLMLLIVYSLGSALYYMVKDGGNSTRMVRSLTIRIALSLILFVIMMAWTYIEYVHEG